MSNVKITQLPSLAGLQSGDQFPVVDTGTTYNVTAAAIQTFVVGSGFNSTGAISATGTVTGGNLATGGTASATGAITSGANITGANILTGGTVSATATITGGNLATGGSVSAIGTISATGAITSAANITGANILTSGAVSSTGAATHSALTLGTPLTTANGGTNGLTANNVLLGNGASAPQVVAPSTAGKVLASTGTTWVSSTIQASGAKLGLGLTGEVWNNVTSSRTSGTTYTNSYSYPIAVSASGTAANGGPSITIVVNGVTVSYFNWQFNGAGAVSGGFTIVPAGATYSLTFNGSGIGNWAELY